MTYSDIHYFHGLRMKILKVLNVKYDVTLAIEFYCVIIYEDIIDVACI